jgi:hypothetical protein
MAKQLQGLQENLEKNSVTMAESERRTKEKEFGELSREFQRRQREFREDLNLRQNEENAAVIEKANKAIKQIAESDKYDLILQDVVWVSPASILPSASSRRCRKPSNGFPERVLVHACRDRRPIGRRCAGDKQTRISGWQHSDRLVRATLPSSAIRSSGGNWLPVMPRQ